jgi:hypothetical protein
VARAALFCEGHNCLPPACLVTEIASLDTVALPVYWSLTDSLHAAVLREKVTLSQLVKKFPAFYETRRFIATFTKARHFIILHHINPLHVLPFSFC